MPKAVPPDFKPKHFVRCEAPLGADGFHLAWDGDVPVAECWDCVNKLGA